MCILRNRRALRGWARLRSMSRRIRILFLHEGVYRKFWWFEVKGDDLYFGPSTPGRPFDSVDFDGTEVSLTIPDSFELLAREQLKLSYHASGQIHLKRGTGGIEA